MIKDYYIDAQVNCAFILHANNYEKGEGIEALYQLAGDPLHKPGMNIYQDNSHSNFPPEYNFKYFKEKIALDLNVKLPKLLGVCKIGWLVNSARDYSVVHQVSVSTRLTPIGMERKPFREQSKLLAWLGLPETYQVEFSKEPPAH
jgi:hypothetical protein